MDSAFDVIARVENGLEICTTAIRRSDGDGIGPDVRASDSVLRDLSRLTASERDSRLLLLLRELRESGSKCKWHSLFDH